MAKTKLPVITTTVRGKVHHEGTPTVSSLIDFATAVDALAAEYDLGPDTALALSASVGGRGYAGETRPDYVSASFTTDVEV